MHVHVRTLSAHCDWYCNDCNRRAIGKVFKGKAIEKGVAFPTCVSVNRYGGCIKGCMQHGVAVHGPRPVDSAMLYMWSVMVATNPVV